MNHPKAVVIAASILSADFLNLKLELDRLINAGITTIHYDVMDNHFVNNLSFGAKILNDVCDYVKKFGVKIDCHFMVKIPNNQSLKSFLKPYQIEGVRNLAFHYEALTKEQLHELLTDINGYSFGLAFNPPTTIEKIIPFLTKVDLILIMSVNPGFGSQLFIENTYQKLAAIQNYMREAKIKKPPIVAVDGGINNVTGHLCCQAGANYLVSGSYLINLSPEELKKQVKQLSYAE